MSSPLDRLPFPLLLFARTHTGGHASLSTLTLFAIATSVAMATGLQTSSRSVEDELARTANEIAGAAQISVTAGDVGLAESLRAAVAAVPGVRAAAPVLQARATVDGGPLGDRAVRLMGVDLAADIAVRTYQFAQGGFAIPSRTGGTGGAVPDDPPAVVVSDALARDLRLELGSRLAVRIGREARVLAVGGILAPRGIADAFAGRIAVIDVAALQAIVGRAGWLDRIDIVVKPGRDVAEVSAAVAARTAGQATVRRAETRNDWVAATLGAVRLVAWSMIAIAVLVASLLVYGTMSLFVERRSRELSLLRTIGLDARGARRLLYVDALILALAGTALGLVAGVGVAGALFAALSRVTDLLHGMQPARLEPTWTALGVAVLVGVGVAMAGVVIPARRFSRTAPLEGLAHGRAAPPPPAFAHTRGILLAAVAGWLLALLAPVGLPASARIVVLFGLGLVALAAAAHDPIPRLVARLRSALDAVLPGIGRLAGASIVARPSRTAIHIGAIAGVLAGITTTTVLNQSVALTLDRWMAAMYPGGIFVTAGSGFSVQPQDPIPKEVVRAIRETPGVVAVFDHYVTEALYDGVEVLLAASDMRVMAEHGVLPALDRDPRALALAVAEGGIAVSDRFAARFGVRAGDAITIDTPQGARRFAVAGVMRDYAGRAGSLNLDIRVFDALWDRPGSRDLIFWADGPAGAVIRAIEERTASADLAFAHGEDFRRWGSRLVGRFGRILDVIAAMTASLGGIAVLNLLLGAVGERRRELALLRSAGATRTQVSLLVLIDGLLAGTIGGIAGVALGIACAWPLITRVIPVELGWWLDFHLDPGRLALILAAVASASLLAGLYPAWLARRVASREVLAPE